VSQGPSKRNRRAGSATGVGNLSCLTAVNDATVEKLCELLNEKPFVFGEKQELSCRDSVKPAISGQILTSDLSNQSGAVAKRGTALPRHRARSISLTEGAAS
jgi:hypothetical protein